MCLCQFLCVVWCPFRLDTTWPSYEIQDKVVAQNLSASWLEEGFFLSIRREKGSGQVLLTASLVEQPGTGLAFAIGVAWLSQNGCRS